ncbi:MAG: CsgG/HfaB family protein [bacterium]|nr:CsgG/HfaB family protein [bacterium]
MTSKYPSLSSRSRGLVRLLKICLAAVLCAAALPACSSLDLQVQQEVREYKGIYKIAVLPFQIEDGEWGEEFASAVGLHLARIGRFVQVERAALSRILDEQRFAESGLVDNETRKKIGQLTGADLILTGVGKSLKYDRFGRTYTNLVDTATITAIDVQTGRHLFTFRKAPGSAWDWRYRAKYIMGLTLIWDRDDVLVDSSKYDDLAYQFSVRMDESFAKQEKAPAKDGEEAEAEEGGLWSLWPF